MIMGWGAVEESNYTRVSSWCVQCKWSVIFLQVDVQ